MPRDDKTRLMHMLAEARKMMARIATCNRADLDSNDDLAAAIVWRLTVIGEAASKVTDPTRVQHPEIPWPQIVSMRYRLIHGYDSIDREVVWQTVTVDIPPLVRSPEAIHDP